MLRRLSLVFAIMMLLGLIAACGDDDDDNDSGAEAEATDAATATSQEPDPTATATLQPDALPATPTTGASADVELVEPPEIPEGIPRDGTMLGDPNAAVQIVEYGDFQ